MRISDWSSDVCSSDLTEAHLRLRRIADAEIARDELAAVIVQHRPRAAVRAAGGRRFLPAHQLVLPDDGPVALHPAVAGRSRARGDSGIALTAFALHTREIARATFRERVFE